jgi:hypothetical protein
MVVARGIVALEQAPFHAAPRTHSLGTHDFLSQDNQRPPPLDAADARRCATQVRFQTFWHLAHQSRREAQPRDAPTPWPDLIPSLWFRDREAALSRSKKPLDLTSTLREVRDPLMRSSAVPAADPDLLIGQRSSRSTGPP